MLRILIITLSFLGITTELLTLQPSQKSDRFVKTEVTPSQEPLAVPEVSRVLNSMGNTDVSTLSTSLAPTMDPIKPIAPVDPIAQVFADLTTNISSLEIRPTLWTNPAITGLIDIDIVIVALEQEMTSQKIDILLSQAKQSGAIAVPAGWRTAKGTLGTTMLLAKGLQYQVQSKDSLVVIAYTHYGGTTALEDIFWANRDKLSSPDALIAELSLHIQAL